MKMFCYLFFLIPVSCLFLTSCGLIIDLNHMFGGERVYLHIRNSIDKTIAITFYKYNEPDSDSLELAPGQTVRVPCACTPDIEIKDDKRKAINGINLWYDMDTNKRYQWIRRDLLWKKGSVLLGFIEKYSLNVEIRDDGVYAENKRGTLTRLNTFELD